MSRYLPVRIAIGVFFGVCLASAQVNTGTISGIVQDASGAAIAEAVVNIRNVDTGAARTVPTDSGGR